MLEILEISKKYSRGRNLFSAVDNVSLKVESGDFINIIGRSGSGKSTLINIASGMLKPDSGKVIFKSEDLYSKSDYELSRIRNEKIGFIPQGISALSNFTVLENVLLPFYLYTRSGDAESYALKLLEKFGIINLCDSYPDELSGGELRRVIIARALINQPEIIIADEPTSDLDVKSSHNIMEIFSRLNDEGLTILLVSHDLDSLKYGKKVFTMKDGNIFSGNAL